MGVELKVWTEGNILTASAEIKKASGCQCSRDALRISIEHPVIAYLKKLEGVLSPCTSLRPSQRTKKLMKENCKARVIHSEEAKQNVIGYKLNPEEQRDSSGISIQVVSPKVDASSSIASTIRNLVSAAEEGLHMFPPELCDEGVNGTYFLKDKSGRNVAVFKPEDEQGNSDQNPKSPKAKLTQKISDIENDPAVPEEDMLETNSLAKSLFSSEEEIASDSNNIERKGLVKGEITSREVGASLLDHEGFYGVPVTCSVCIIHPAFNGSKIGSLQAFIENDGASWDVGCTVFPINEVHKIGVLDLHIFNTDRHEGNILIQKIPKDNDSPATDALTYKLIPIDHGYSLPHSLDAAWFDWLTWPQAKKPFDRETLNYIERLNPESDAILLEDQLNIRKECLRTMKISTTFLKKGAKHGLTLFEIGDMVCRRDVSKPSELELMHDKAYDQLLATQLAKDVDNNAEENLFLEILNGIMDEELEKKALKRQRFNTV